MIAFCLYLLDRYSYIPYRSLFMVCRDSTRSGKQHDWPILSTDLLLIFNLDFDLNLWCFVLFLKLTVRAKLRITFLIYLFFIRSRVAKQVTEHGQIRAQRTYRKLSRM